jgi:hypothetical protein
LKAGEKIIEALELADEDQLAMQAYEQVRWRSKEKLVRFELCMYLFLSI